MIPDLHRSLGVLPLFSGDHKYTIITNVPLFVGLVGGFYQGESVKRSREGLRKRDARHVRGESEQASGRDVKLCGYLFPYQSCTKRLYDKRTYHVRLRETERPRGSKQKKCSHSRFRLCDVQSGRSSSSPDSRYMFSSRDKI